MHSTRSFAVRKTLRQPEQSLQMCEIIVYMSWTNMKNRSGNKEEIDRPRTRAKKRATPVAKDSSTKNKNHELFDSNVLKCSCSGQSGRVATTHGRARVMAFRKEMHIDYKAICTASVPVQPTHTSQN